MGQLQWHGLAQYTTQFFDMFMKKGIVVSIALFIGYRTFKVLCFEHSNDIVWQNLDISEWQRI